MRTCVWPEDCVAWSHRAGVCSKMEEEDGSLRVSPPWITQHAPACRTNFWARCKTRSNKGRQRTTVTMEKCRFTFHPVLSQHQKHLENLQTPRRQSLVDSWPPKHSSRDRSSQMFSPTHSCFRCVPDSRRKPCSQEDTLCAERGLKKKTQHNKLRITDTQVRMRLESPKTLSILSILWHYVYKLQCKLIVAKCSSTKLHSLDWSTAASISPPLCHWQFVPLIKNAHLELN